MEGQNASLQHALPTLMLSMKLCHPTWWKKPENKQLASNRFFLVKPITRRACVYCTVNGPNKEKKALARYFPFITAMKEKVGVKGR